MVLRVTRLVLSLLLPIHRETRKSNALANFLCGSGNGIRRGSSNVVDDHSGNVITGVLLTGIATLDPQPMNIAVHKPESTTFARFTPLSHLITCQFQHLGFATALQKGAALLPLTNTPGNSYVKPLCQEKVKPRLRVAGAKVRTDGISPPYKYGKFM